MQIERQEVIDLIDNAKYFDEAKRWYSKTYIAAVSERSYMLIAAIFSFIMLCISIANVNELLPTNYKIPFTIYVENSSDYFSRIRSLSAEGQSPQDAVASYLLGDFIIARESYYPTLTTKDFEYRKRKIRNLATKAIYNEYIRATHKTNINSPIYRYRDKIARIITIDSISYNGNNPLSGSAKVIFVATLQGGAKNQASKWQADVQYRLQDISVIAKTGSPLRYKVLYYKVRPYES